LNGDLITPGAWPIRGIGYRRDLPANAKNPYAGRSITRLIVRLGYSKNSPSAMSTAFANNRSGTLTTVFDGTYNLPTLPVVSPPAPFAVQIAFKAPFVYQRNLGHLLIEFEVPGNANQKFEYYLDAHSTLGSASKVASYGSAGPLKTAENYTVTGDAATLFPGGAVTLQASGLASAYPAIAAYGFSNTSYGALKLPFDLTPVGAPNNSLYASLDLMAPLVLTQQASGYAGQAMVPIPADSAFIGLNVFGQAIFVDPPSNALNLVFSNGVQFVVGEIVPTQILGTSSSTAATGFFPYPSGRYGGPVIELK